MAGLALDRFSTVLLDMNDTFMFGADRFGPSEDFSIVYRQLGGTLPAARVNQLIRSAYAYLDDRYPDPHYRENFPAVSEALMATGAATLSVDEVVRLVETFARHELGQVPLEYATAIWRLSQRFRLGLVIDIWAPKTLWVEALNQANILMLCEATVFSSDCRMVKPSPQPFLSVLEQMQVRPQDAVMIGDSVRRDLDGARAAGIACVLVGGATHEYADASVGNLLELVAAID
ncbi:HAD family hydrolase [filamentous cyanobacterium LEGE 11480]|uniref:HAD family hydrolase n=1 Tax=Romeriopsis navalis LEGE 11480 TaxID=2777977 RepID=A0A928Z6W2_9CYAN|nr:HAD family hydrolase [Romeriopsis navalis]MBE9032615.1 HAD family hydrolase [Romeriopsis navalis LEGE 11480]